MQANVQFTPYIWYENIFFDVSFLYGAFPE